MRASHARRRERGAVAALLLLALAMLVAFVASSLNLGHIASTRSEVQTGADAGALAGARILDGTEGKLDPAKATASSFGSANPSDGTNLGVPLGDVTVGHWDVTTRTFSELPAAQAKDIQAVRVWTYRDSAHAGGAVAQSFSSFLGLSSTRDVAGKAIAVGGGPSFVPCAQMPIAISQCYLDSGNHCDETFRVYFYNDNNDTAAWTTFTLVANAHNIINLLDSAVNNTCTPIGIDNVVNITNGQVNSACQELETVYAREGPNHLYVVPVIDTGSCPAKFVQTATVSTFVYIQIVGLNCMGNPKYVDVMLRCNQAAPPGSHPGGEFNQSILPLPPALVE